MQMRNRRGSCWGEQCDLFLQLPSNSFQLGIQKHEGNSMTAANITTWQIVRPLWNLYHAILDKLHSSWKLHIIFQYKCKLFDLRCCLLTDDSRSVNRLNGKGCIAPRYHLARFPFCAVGVSPLFWVVASSFSTPIISSSLSASLHRITFLSSQCLQGMSLYIVYGLFH